MQHAARGHEKTLILILLSPFFKYLLKLIISPFIDGITSYDILIADLYSYGVSGVLEVLQYLIVTALTYTPAKKYRQGLLILKKTDEISSEKKSISYFPLIPFKKLFSLKNPLQLGAIISAGVIVLGRITSLAISDINNHWKIVGINQYITFFAPYVVETVVGFIGYFFMLYLFIQIYSKTSDQ